MTISDESPVVFSERAFATASEVLAGFATLTGYVSGRGSSMGWSKWATLQRCPYAYWRRYVAQVPQEFSLALEIGSYVHAFLAGRHGLGWDLARLELLRDEWLSARGSPEAICEAWRCIAAYCVYYECDYLIPLACELTAHDSTTRMSCRYDMIARIDDPPETIQAGIYLVEHKTASFFSATTVDGWDLDGEILGQIMIWHHSGLTARYGALRGVIVNLLGKQQVVKFHRTFIHPDTLPWREHRKTLAWCKTLRDRCARERRWPRFFGGCIGRYGRCEHYFHCSGLQIAEPQGERE